jgi:hypothetical protein
MVGPHKVLDKQPQGLYILPKCVQNVNQEPNKAHTIIYSVCQILRAEGRTSYINYPESHTGNLTAQGIIIRASNWEVVFPRPS